MNSWHLHIEGQVQGVGFRPYVYRLAQQHQLCGWVNNTVDGVHIVFNAEDAAADRFRRDLIAGAPALARITADHMERSEPRSFDRFEIIHSRTEGRVNLLITPDFAICADCRRELEEADNRRRAYPFITCTNCGPRYSITRRLPYDRHTTTMAHFSMCADCRREYDDPNNRRYYSQTNSCPECPVQLSLTDRQQQLLSSDPADIQSRILRYWEAGKIVAIKGIGGYLLTCDAGGADVVQLLRSRKHRPSKPFALMYPTITAIKRDAILPAEAEAELLSYRAPIVLLEARPQAARYLALDDLAPGLSKLGIMLPYTPLFASLLAAFDRPIVATSGNLSNAPIVFEDTTAQQELTAIADYVLGNDRAIVVPQDDSVLQFTPHYRRPIVLRRSRGIAPGFHGPGIDLGDQTILATGAMLKSTFAYHHQGNTFISQYLGDLQHFDTEQSYRHTLEHFRQLFDADPQLILTDRHPDYASTRIGREMADTLDLPIQQYQHHLAHFGAILGERDLLHGGKPVLGVIWDGTGLGDDGQIWGGEFFRYEALQFTRCRHLAYFDALLGDKMAREPRISALALASSLPAAQAPLQAKFSNAEWQLYRKILDAGSPLQTSSMGRLFDAVASLLGLADRQSYEGEAAMRLEQLARNYFRSNGYGLAEYYPLPFAGKAVSVRPLISAVVQDLNGGSAAGLIAAKFHRSLAALVGKVAEDQQVDQLAFSGGVFQNSTLVDLLIHHLGDHYQLYFHRVLSPNDENVSYGQLVCYYVDQRQAVNQQKKNTEQHVFSDSRENTIH